MPDEAGRVEILNIHTKKMKLAPDVDILEVAKKTHGFVGADLRGICQKAALQCVREKMDLFDMDDEVIDAEVLASMFVDDTHFAFAVGESNPASLRELSA